MRIQHNIPAMSAYRNYTNNVSAMKKNLEKLSSGYKINRAGDDAAGLAISEKMRAQITGLQVAQKNAKDGISLVQTAEGALTEVHDMLNRMYSLAEQSANGTYDNEVDRVQLQKEIDSLRTEIDRISESANFNGIKLLNGDQATTSTSALGATATVVDGSAINGTNPSAAGAAEVTVDLRSSASANSTTLDTVSAKDGDGSNVIPATKAEITLKVGGVAGDPATKINVKGKINGGATDVDADTFDGTKWDAGSYIEVTAGGKTYKFSHGTMDGYTNVGANLATKLTEVGLTLNNAGAAGANITAAAGGISGFNGTNQIVAGTTTVADLKALTPIAGTKLEDQFEITVTAADGTTKRTTDTDKIQNGDTITLTAKKAGALETGGGKVFDALKGLTATYPTGVTDTDAQAALAGKVTATNGKDEGYATAGVQKTKYEISFDVADLTGGKKITIGSKSITFSALDPAATGTLSGNAMVVNVAKKDANANGNTDEIAADLKTALDDLFGATNFETATWTNENGKYTYTIESKTGANDTATNTSIVAANMGQVRVFQANKDGTGETEITDTDKAIQSTYTAGVEKDTTAPAQNAFAKVTYAITDDMLVKGNKLTIGGVEIEIADATDAKAGKISKTKTDFVNDLAKVLEEQGYTAGKVTAAAGTGTAAGQNGVATTATALIIEGTKVGESAADFKAGAGAVSLYDKSKAPNNKVTAGSGASAIDIEAGVTKVSDLLGKEMIAADATNNIPAKNLGDLFTITDANGRELAKDHVIADGETIKFVAKNKGALDQTTLDKLTFTAATGATGANVTVKNGWDEGSSASGDRTHYELQFDLNNLHGGQSFTFGNDTKTVTFEITYDANGKTENGTINDKDNTNVNGDANTNRVLINLYGKTTDKEKIDTIMAAFDQSGAADLKADFAASYSATAGKLTVMLDAKGDGADYNWGNVRVSNNNSALTGSVYNPAGGAAQGTIGTYAQIAYEFDVSKLQEGDSLTVGGTTIYFGKEDKVEKDGKGSKVTLALDAAKSDVSKIVKGLESAGYRSGKVAIDTSKNTITITGVDTGETADHLKTNGARISVGTTTNRPMATGGLKLQIGDTAEDFNQMAVDIKECSSNAMGIGGIDISSQTGAVDAMAKIKDAINYVSDIRGGLGATQNRLDHTINNLSVMQENIQDAESSIRDVDVAEEMMAYTKNNILIQSAQAMLAQANQMPQGVLQLLG